MERLKNGEKLKQALASKKITKQDFAKSYVDFSRQSLHSLIKQEKFTLAHVSLFTSLLGLEPEDFGVSTSALVSEFSTQINLSNLQLEGLNFDERYLKRVNWSGSTIKHSTLKKAFMPYSNFSNSILEQVSFEEATLYNSNFSNSRLYNVIFRSANLTEANFSNANFTQVNLHKSNLSKSNFSDGEFHKADLSFTNLQEANLNNANLSQTNLQGCDLKGVINWENCLLHHAFIDGIINPPNGFIEWASNSDAHNNFEEWQDWQEFDFKLTRF